MLTVCDRNMQIYYWWNNKLKTAKEFACEFYKVQIQSRGSLFKYSRVFLK